MKTSCFVFALLVSTLAGVQAQVTATGTATTASQTALPTPTAFSAVSRDAGSTVWERTVYSRGPNATVVPRKSRYTELCSGLNFKDSQTGQWRPSREKIDLLPPGGAFAAAATQGSHKASFPLDITRGVIQLSGPDGKQLTSRPVGLFYEDDSSSALIATLSSSVGGLVGSNEVVYPDAFEGASASLHYKYTRAGFEQDVVIQGALPDPAALGLNPARTRLGVLTAFFDTNNPVATTGPTDPAEGLSDSTLRFGAMTMTKGRAFSIGNTEQSPPPANVTPANWLNWMTNAVRQSSSKGTSTYKRWFQLNGHNFLMEEVPYHRVAAQLKQFPPATGRAGIIATNLFAANSILNGVSAGPLPQKQFSKSEIGNQKSAMTRLSRADWDQTQALVLDYVIAPSDGGSYTFRGDSTYYVTGPCYFDNVTLEAGTVIKYANVNSVDPTQIGSDYANAFIEVDGTLTCQTSSSRPAVFTAADDNTVGETISGSTGNPSGNYYANPAIYYVGYDGNFNLSNVRINYAQKAVWVGDYYRVILSDLQVNACQCMVVLGCDDGAGWMSLTCNNCLYNSPAGILVMDYGWGGGYYSLNNCTFNNVYCLASCPNENDYNYCYAVNCIFANSSLYVDGYEFLLQGSYNGFYNSAYTFGSHTTPASSFPFQTAGSDNYYLAADYPFRNAGTANIDLNLLADLRTRTTYAPQDGSYVDNDGQPDLGYHYPIPTDSDGDGLPDWWEMYWFGNLNHSGSDLDGGGYTLLSDYQSGTDLSAIQFSIESTNNYVHVTSANVQLNIMAGVPYYYAVFVGSTTTTNWLPFTSTNLTVSLGPTDGIYYVEVGLKALPPGSPQIWQEYCFHLDRRAPALTITNPVLVNGTGTVIKPYLQLQGFADAALASLSYDISNATGVFTNLNVSVIDQVFDTNTFDFSTNFFQAYDVPLAANDNVITLRVTDRAGNITTTNIDAILDYTTATTPPEVKLIWPTNGMLVSGSSITIRGMMSDETGTIVAQVTNGDGTISTVPGLVERNNMFWIENVPLNGINQIGIQATDASGNNVTTTNFTINPSPVVLTIDSTPTGDGLWQPVGIVGGTVGDPNATVVVNGMTAVVQTTANQSDTYDWTASNVPSNGKGTATFDAVANAAGGGGGGGGTPEANASAAIEMGPYWTIVEYFCAKTYNRYSTSGPEELYNYASFKDYSAQANPGADGQWHETYTGYMDASDVGFHEGRPYSDEWIYNWSDSNPGTEQDFCPVGQLAYSGPLGYQDDPILYEEVLSEPDADQSDGCAGCGVGYGASFIYHYRADNVRYSWNKPSSVATLTAHAGTVVKLYTGGKAKVNRQNLFCINASAQEYTQPSGNGPGWWWDTLPLSVDNSKLTVAGKQVGADGNVWAVLPDNSEQDITVTAHGVQHYNAWATPTKIKSHFQVFVRMPYPLYPYDWWNADLPGYPRFSLSSILAGHAWWKLTSDAPIDVIKQQLIKQQLTPDSTKWIGMETGFAPLNAFDAVLGFQLWESFQSPGMVDLDGWNTHEGSADKYPIYAISFDGLIAGLNHTENFANHIPYWDSRWDNCAEETLITGGAAGVKLPSGSDDWLPEYFGYHLPPSTP